MLQKNALWSKFSIPQVSKQNYELAKFRSVKTTNFGMIYISARQDSPANCNAICIFVIREFDRYERLILPQLIRHDII